VAAASTTCPAGSLCRNGQCNSTGLYVAGLTYPEGRTTLAPETVIAALGPSGWYRVNITALPRVVQLLASADGEWLFALTDDVAGGDLEGSLWRSADGVGWVKVFDGANRATSGAAIGVAVDYPTRSLVIGINGGASNGLAGALRSNDNGTTWTRVATANADPGGTRGTVTGVAPNAVLVSRANFSNVPGLYPTDGGARIVYFPGADSLLLSDPTGVGPPLIAQADLRLYDGGIVGPVTVPCTDCRVYGPGDSLVVVSTSTVWYSPTPGAIGIRPFPTTPPVLLTALTRGADERLVVGNFNAQPPLFASNDEGLSWDQLGADWFASPDLGDPTPPWEPDASYVGGQRVRPTVPNGWIYERFGGGTGRSGGVEPAFPPDGGVVAEPGVSWRGVTRHLGMRVTAMVSLRCSAGQQRCATGCVDITSSATNCGGCGLVCNGTCRNGVCEVVDAGVVQSGCADGTREGFVDDVAWPDVAACKGTWSGDLSAAADTLCGAGFHVCTEQDTEPRAVRYLDALAFPGCFAYRASNDDFDGCEPLECQGNPARDDMAGMGRGCLLVSGVSWSPAQVPDGGASCLADRGRIDSQCCAGSVTVPGATRLPGCRQRGEDGVVCCRD
jgi:hypothetical protein